MITVFGSINADLIFALDNLPLPGQTLLSQGMRIEAGGKGANQAVAAARDGAAVRMVGAVGEDAMAAPALAGLRASPADISAVRSIAGAATGCASINTDRHGRNQIVVASGANMDVRADAVADAWLGAGQTLVLQMEVKLAENAALIHRARAAGTRIILNLAPEAPFDAELLAMLDLLVVNEDEAAALATRLGTAAAAAALQAVLGCGVVRTLGAQGLEAATAEGALRLRAWRVDAIDTTAAGDCFVGVMAAALDRGDALPAALHRASAAAAIACTRRGSQGSIPEAADTDALLSRNP